MITQDCDNQLRNRQIIESVLSQILSNSDLSMPLYCGFIESEEHASELRDILPLIYIWNENQTDRTFSLSINSSIVGSLLETIITRNNPDFNYIRDEVLSKINEISILAVLKTCEKTGVMPSVAFGS